MCFLPSYCVYLKKRGIFIPITLRSSKHGTKNGHCTTELKTITLTGCKKAILKYYFLNANEMEGGIAYMVSITE